MTGLQLQKFDGRRIIRTTRFTVFFLLLLTGIAGMQKAVLGADAQSIPESSPQFVTPGSLVICGGGILPAKLIDKFIELGGGPRARVVIVSSASIYADTDIRARLSGWYDRLSENHIASLEILHTRSREKADEPEFSQILESATAVWFLGGNQNWVAQTYLGTRTEERLHAVLARGGAIGGTSAGAAIMSRCMIADGKTEPLLSTGFGFLPGTIVDQHFKKRNRSDRLMRALELRPGLVGIGIDEGTALIVRGRSLEVIGDSDASVCLSPSVYRPAKMESLTVGKQADLVVLRRAAWARAEDLAESDDEPQVPGIQNGTLVIAGGGPTPPEVIDTFLTAAGGMDAPIVVVANSMNDTVPDQSAVCGWLSAAGAKNVHMLHALDRNELSNPHLLALLKEARGVWFTAGRPWRMIDACLDTPVEELFHDVLRRGGVIGGTSEGANVQGEYLVSGNPKGTDETVEEGYDRGFGFLPCVAIDQHFTKRDRLEEMAQLKKTYPDMVGLGVDESTAMVVRGTTMQVVGQHNVTVFDKSPKGSPESPELAVLKSGERYDFRHHRRMETAATEVFAPTK
jgi:cyanophycinase